MKQQQSPSLQSTNNSIHLDQHEVDKENQEDSYVYDIFRYSSACSTDDNIVEAESQSEAVDGMIDSCVKSSGMI